MSGVVMWKIAWFLVIIFCIFRVTCMPGNESMIEFVVERVKNLDYDQLVIFKNSEGSSRDPGVKLPKFMEHMKTILVDIEEPICSSSFGISRASTLCIILQNEEIDDRVKRAHDVMKFLIKASPTSTRPNCLMVAHNDTYSDESFTSILLQAWSLKFLDFTIAFESDEGLPQMLSYNPFTKSYYTDEVTNTSLLFPDKLSNMNGYPLKIPIYNLRPYNYFFLKDDRIASVEGYDYPFVEMFSRKLNFSLQYFVVEEAENVTALFEKQILLLENSKVNMIPKPLYLGTHYYGRNVVIGKAYRDTSYVLVVPLLHWYESEMRHYLRMLEKLAYFPGNVLFLKLAFHLLRFRLNQWTHLLQMLVGSTLAKRPKRVAERIVFFTVVLLSMIFSSDVFASLTDTKVASDEVPFETFDEIISSNLTVYARITSSERGHPVFDMLNARNIKNISDCIFELTRTKCCICIVPKMAALYLIDAFEDQSNPTVKISRLTLYSDKMGFGFESASPYAEKIDVVLQALIEAGVQSSWRYTQLYDKVRDRKERCERRSLDADPSDEKIVFQFAAMLLVFHSIATVVFLVELVTKRIGHRVRRLFVAS